jgi:hypothetical protein
VGGATERQRRSFAWLIRFRRLARTFEWRLDTFAALHYVDFAGLMLRQFTDLIQSA